MWLAKATDTHSGQGAHLAVTGTYARAPATGSDAGWPTPADVLSRRPGDQRRGTVMHKNVARVAVTMAAGAVVLGTAAGGASAGAAGRAGAPVKPPAVVASHKMAPAPGTVLWVKRYNSR